MDACSQNGVLTGRTFDVLGPSRAFGQALLGCFWGDLGRILGAVLGHAMCLGAFWHHFGGIWSILGYFRATLVEIWCDLLVDFMVFSC